MRWSVPCHAGEFFPPTDEPFPDTNPNSPMARRFAWSDVRAGLIAMVALVVIAAAIIKYSRVGALHGDTIHVYALVGEARGVMPGSEVWLSGQKIGKISRIDFQPAARTDTSVRILISMEVLSAHLNAVHRDAIAQIRAGGSVIGAPVVYFTTGSTRSRPLRDGDTVSTHAQADVEGATAQFSAASREAPVIMANVKVLLGQLQTTRGTVGAFMNGPGLGELGTARIQAMRVVNRLTGGGTAGLIMKGGLSVRAQRVMSRVDSIRVLLASNRTSLGRFRRDSTLVTEVADVRRELAALSDRMQRPDGTVGRVMRDSAITIGLADASREMTLLFADLKAHPFRYISF